MNPKFIFIIPYRNRNSEKKKFEKQIKYLLEDYDNNSFEIFYCHQNDERPFNRGAIKNIGFLVLKNKYPNDYKNITFIFNDIDCFPNIKNIVNYDTKLGIINHIYGFNFTLGGIFSIKGKDYEDCCGFPNYWGWGLEDNFFNDKILSSGLQIDRSKLFSIGCKEITHYKDDGKIKLINDIDVKNYFSNNIVDNLKYIKNLDYEIIKNEDNNLINQYIINVNNFNTLYNYNKNNFYFKDVSLSNKLTLNKHSRNVSKRWKMF